MPIEDDFNPSAGNPLISGQEGYDPQTAPRRPQVAQAETPSADQVRSSHWAELSASEQRKAIALGTSAAALAAMAIIAGPNLVDSLNGPEYSPTTKTFTAQDGDDWYTVANAVEGHNAVDTTDLINHIKADPANISLLTSDELHPGQSIVIPTSVNR